MKPLGRRAYKDKNSKGDYHPKKIFDCKNEELDKRALRRNHKVERYFQINQYQNWWEDVSSYGSGKLKMDLENEIEEELILIEQEADRKEKTKWELYID